MSEGEIFHTQPMERIREGMTVVDRAGTRLGTVEYIKLGDPGAATAEGSELRDPLTRGVANLTEGLLPFAHEREPDVQEPLRRQLLRTGFIKIHGPGLIHHNRYVGAGQIAGVAGDTVTVGDSMAESDALAPDRDFDRPL
jgi:hypothetical protein